MENVLRCLNRVDRFLGAEERGLEKMRPYMRRDISQGVEEACRFAEGICDEERIAAIFKEELSMIIDDLENQSKKNQLRSRIRTGLTSGVREAVRIDAAHEKELQEMFREVLDEVWQEKLGP